MPSCTVALKMPHGLHLRLFNTVMQPEPQPGGGTKDVPRAEPRPETVILKGYLDKYDPSLPTAARGSSYALTQGVDLDFMNEWLKQNHDLDLVKNKLILIHGKDTKGMAVEHKDTRSGLEPVDPTKLRGRIQTADEQKKALGISA